MKRKPDTHTAIRRLHDAAQDIVQGFRNVSADVYKTPQHNAEVRIPVLMQGTDMRVTIESGPSVAMRNAVEHAAMKASDKPYLAAGEEAKQEAVAVVGTFDAKRLMAIEKRHRYLALIDTGFTESQALALCDKP